MPKFFVTQPTSFLADGETTMGTYNWCVDNAGCEKAMCAITNVSYNMRRIGYDMNKEWTEMGLARNGDEDDHEQCNGPMYEIN